MGVMGRAIAMTGGGGSMIDSPNDRRGIAQRIHLGLNLHLSLKNPAQMRGLLAFTDSQQEKIRAALLGLHYVHFAHFLPAMDFSALWVITVFDGALKSRDGDLEGYEDSMRAYITDFAATLGDVFTGILDFVKDAPRLPVCEYVPDFVDFVLAHDVPNVEPWSAYESRTVIDIQTSRTR